MLGFFSFGCSVNGFSQAQERKRIAHVGLIYPLSTNGIDAAEYTNSFSLHAIAGISKAETGVAVSGVALLVKENAKGLLISGVSNIILNSAQGVQIAGVTNIIKHDARGVQIAGFMNFGEEAGQVQVAGFSNITSKSVKGLQLSGFLNKTENVNTQVSGFMNIAKNVKGIQLAGLINIADSSDYPIALLNFVKNGEKSISLTIDETATIMASFRSGGRVLYGILGLGYNLKSDNHALYGVEAGLGAHIPVSNKLRINTEIVSQTLSDFKTGDYFKSALRILLAFKLTPQLEIFGGPSLNYTDYSKGKGDGLVSHYLWKDRSGQDLKGLYPGFTAGVHFIL